MVMLVLSMELRSEAEMPPAFRFIDGSSGYWYATASL